MEICQADVCWLWKTFSGCLVVQTRFIFKNVEEQYTTAHCGLPGVVEGLSTFQISRPSKKHVMSSKLMNDTIRSHFNSILSIWGKLFKMINVRFYICLLLQHSALFQLYVRVSIIERKKTAFWTMSLTFQNILELVLFTLTVKKELLF